MSLLTDEHPPAKRTRGLGARAWQVVSIAMTILTPWVFYGELKEAYRNGVALETPENSKTFTGRLETAVNAQLAVCKRWIPRLSGLPTTRRLSRPSAIGFLGAIQFAWSNHPTRFRLKSSTNSSPHCLRSLRML
jgi:hypothetical protein